MYFIWNDPVYVIPLLFLFSFFGQRERYWSSLFSCPKTVYVSLSALVTLEDKILNSGDHHLLNSTSMRRCKAICYICLPGHLCPPNLLVSQQQTRMPLNIATSCLGIVPTSPSSHLNVSSFSAWTRIDLTPLTGQSLDLIECWIVSASKITEVLLTSTRTHQVVIPLSRSLSATGSNLAVHSVSLF